MVDGKGGHEFNIGMAVFANIGSQYVSETFANGVAAVVTADAVVNNVHMTECGRQPADGRMAIVTIGTSINMSRVLACRNDAVMAGFAGT
jgi:hypothetical protein